MLIPILIFVMSFAATLQFAIFSWRARLMRFTTQALEGQVYVATATMLTDKSFAEVTGYQQFCPSLDAHTSSKLATVKLYHGFLKMIGSPDWAKDEMALCAQYASAVLLQRVQRNQVLAAEVCSY